MAEKDSKLEIKVDLDCYCCYKKIQKILCKLQEQENIKTISYDKKSGTVTISGTFDAEKLFKKLRCMACKVIVDIKIVKMDKKEKDEDKGKEKESKPEPCKVINDIKIIVADRLKDHKCGEEERKEPSKPKPDKEQKPRSHPPACCCNVEWCGGPRFCSCGKACGCVADGPPKICVATSCGGCRLICEGNPSTSCTFM